MSKPGREQIPRDVATPQDGSGPPLTKPAPSSCGFCGAEADASGPAVERFGEVFCSEGHAGEFVKEVRAARVQAAAARLLQAPEPETQEPKASAACASGSQGWKRYLKMGLCVGAPLLAIVFLVGGGGALLGATGALLPLLALLACPLAMYFMMRGMMKTEQGGHTDEKREEK